MHNAPQNIGVVKDEADAGWKERTWTYMKFGVYPDSDGWRAMKSEPWSAAFISYLMRMGGAGIQFPYSMSHSTYVMRAVQNRLSGNTKNTITAYSITEVMPSVGDLMWRGRKSEDPKAIDTTGWGFDDIKKHVKSGGDEFPSHCDVITSVELTEKYLYIIGGNVANTVLRMKVPLNSGGMALAKQHTVILKNDME
jgi:hypothetical protein